MESVSTILFCFIGFTIVYFEIIVTVISDRVGLGFYFFSLVFLFLFPNWFYTFCSFSGFGFYVYVL